MAVLIVGTTPGIASVSAAINVAVNGDTIEIPAGNYTENFPTIYADITIEGVGGMAHLTPAGQPSNGKAILVIDANVTLDHIELSGASVPDGNGAGIRFEAGSLTVTNSWIHDNQEGLLANAVAGATITIDHSEFNNNGNNDGLTHNIYVNEIGLLTITNSYIHDALGGHEIKSRADNTVIIDNRIQDGPTADTSYSIDIPDGGAVTITGNVIQKGPNSPNTSAIHFGGELNPSHANSTIDISGNTVINDRPGGVPHLLLNQSTDTQGNNFPASIIGNTVYGIGVADLASGAANISGNAFPVTSPPPLDTSHPFEVACYAAGTRIATPSCAVAVEMLQPGMRIISFFGGTVPIVWIGHRHVDCRAHPRPKDVMPVRVRAGAFGPGLPVRDLLLSPDHAVYADDVLIPICTLINGTSIVQERVDTVTYYHVELPVHDVILAEGLPAESFLDTGNRDAFENGGKVRRLHRGSAQQVWEAEACAPQLRHGPRHAALLARLRARATQHRRAAAG
ncbi:Hint domain-containing protein [Limobrevibacterium gyesilva]|uniref:Hint domain-containing protein n=1 Tax=Limobrevibacterium gyesilva TaxID=2991712 RepID=A0AA41YP48_9PROT|nr:Hint domain-containing protein [Limobrevibacterium gyesilva]MCW3473935.1 Hint domain-containing protein [Limobrevibacterium gyesilva]